MSTMKVARFEEANGELKFAEQPIPEPEGSQVRIKVKACGICHSDIFAQYGMGGAFPRVPGHEVAGVVEKLGPGVTKFKIGDRVGLGWFGGCCQDCDPCVHQNAWVCCDKAGQNIPGITYDGGYAEYCLGEQDALARIPDGLTFVEAGPLCCAGVTVFNALRNSNAKVGDVVAVVGIGALGHLGVQYAAKMGFRTVAVSRGTDKKDECINELGAHLYIDSKADDAGIELGKLGGARVILICGGPASMVPGLMNGLGVNGEILIVAAMNGEITVKPIDMMGKRNSIRVWASGDGRDSQATMEFSDNFKVRAKLEEFSFDDAPKAYNRVMNELPHFKVVLKMED
jgi:D-arabinose 1-dehydrogenase-like Zn-dependent alcohol dehydrogenase